jgi:hypothetical protein
MSAEPPEPVYLTPRHFSLLLVALMIVLVFAIHFGTLRFVF